MEFRIENEDFMNRCLSQPLVRNTFVEVQNLRIGDRFYLANDKKKQVWQKVEGEVKQTAFQTYVHFVKKDSERFAVAIKKETKVIFLRHAD